MQQIHKQIFGTRATRLSTADIPDFPESQIDAVPVDFGSMATNKLNGIYAQMEAALKELQQKRSTDTPAAMTIITRARQEAELMKVPVLIEEAKDAIEQGMSVVIFVNFNATLDEILKNLPKGLNAGVIRGGQNNVLERQRFISEFQADKLRLMVANEAAGGTGISLHDVLGQHARLALISPNFNATTIKQVLGRCWRAGAKSKAIQRILFAVGTPEEKAQAACKSKIANINALIQADLTSGFDLAGFTV
jgi:superfamily II DNA/RNA helicase